MATGSSGLPLAGVEAKVVDFNSFLADLGKMNTATQKTTQGMGRSTQKAGKDFDAFGAILLGVATGGIALFASAAINVLGSALRFVGDMFGAAVDQAIAFGEILIGLAVNAAALPGISQAFGNAIAGTNLSLNQLRTAARGTIADFELMRKVNLGLAGTQGDLKTAFADAMPRFLEIARAASRATGEDVNFMFDSIVRGVKRNSPLIVDNALVTLSAADAYERYANSIGKSVDELTDEEQRIAIINRTLEQGQIMIDQYGGDTLTAADNMAIMRAQAQNITDTLGLALQPAFTIITGKLAEMVNWFAAAISEGGILRPMLVNLAAAAALLADGFAQAIDFIIGFVNSLSGEVSAGISGVISQAFNWGANLVGNLATGIIQAASTVLVQAINFVSSILSFWMAPGSPPRMVPNIDKWGAAAMTEYLKGFTEADFGILDKLSSVFERALGKEGLAGIIDELLMAVDLGEVTGDLFSRIAAESGEFGKELALLAQQQLAVATATERLNEANRDFERSQTKVSKLTREYNDLLRDGASKEILDAKLAQIKAAETERDVAAVNAAEAEGEVEALESQAGAQEELVDQLIKLAELQKSLSTGGGAGGGIGGGIGGLGGAGLGGLGIPDLGDIDEFDLADILTEEIEEAKGIVSKKLQELAAPFAAFFDSLKVAFGDVGGAMTEWQILVGQVFTGIATWISEKWLLIEPILTAFGEMFSIWLTQGIGVFTVAWTTILQPALAMVDTFIRDSLKPLLEALAELLDVTLTKSLEGISAILTEVVLPAWTDWFTFLDDSVKPLLENLADVVLPAVKGAFDSIANAVQSVIGKIEGLTEKIRNMEIPDWLKPGSPPPLAIGLKNIADQFERISRVAPRAFSMPQGNVPVSAIAGARGSTNVEINISTGPITNGMDVTVLRNVILDTVGQAMTQTA